MEMIEFQTDNALKAKFNEVLLQNFYIKYFPKDTYPNLANYVYKIMSLFGNTYRCEQFFSKMSYTKSKHRSRLTDEHLTHTLRLAWTSLNPDIDNLLNNTQSQISH